MADRGSTKQRRLILDILGRADGHLRAKDIYKRALEEDPGISLATVYRNLRLFEELGLVNGKRLDKMRCWYELKRSGDHCDVVCSACGRVLEFESPHIGQLLREVEQRSDFRVTRATLQLEGYCRTCEDRAPD
jgi:Fur family ferric uptake transcriptional regulator